MPFERQRRPHYPRHPGRRCVHRRLHRRHRRRWRLAHHPGPAHRRMPPHLVLGTNKLSSTFGSATASFTFTDAKLFHPPPVGTCHRRYVYRRPGRRHRRPLPARRNPEQDAPGDRLRLWPVPVVRRHAQGAAGGRRTDQEEMAGHPRLRPGLLRRRGRPRHWRVLDGEHDAAAPHRPGQSQRRGAQHELRQQRGGAVGCLSSTVRWTGSSGWPWACR